LIRREIGSGGMGVVYAAHDPQLERVVALKVLKPNAAGSGDEARNRLLREARAMARLSHPNVITVFDVGTIGEQAFIAAEFIDGGNVRAWLAEAKRPWRSVLRVFLHAGRGLAAAHRANLVHRDFK